MNMMGADSGKKDVANCGSPVKWPTEIRDASTIEADSRIWKEFEFREGDIIVASYPKTGTTVAQQILSQIIFNGSEDVPLWEIAPWFEFRLAPKAETMAMLKAQTHRRSIKSHLPAYSVPISPIAKYIYVGRDGRDVAWSFHHHLSNVFDAFNDAQWRLYDPEAKIMSGYPKIPESPYQFYTEWMRDDGFPHGSFFENVQTWWEIRNLPNVLMVHYNNIIGDLPGEIARIAKFLDYDLSTLAMDKIIHHCGFQYMKEHSKQYAPPAFKDGQTVFFNKATNMRWKDILSAAEVAQYEKIAEERLGSECAYWLATGKTKD